MATFRRWIETVPTWIFRVSFLCPGRARKLGVTHLVTPFAAHNLAVLYRDDQIVGRTTEMLTDRDAIFRDCCDFHCYLLLSIGLSLGLSAQTCTHNLVGASDFVLSCPQMPAFTQTRAMDFDFSIVPTPGGP
jgi:hypothetical protein